MKIYIASSICSQFPEEVKEALQNWFESYYAIISEKRFRGDTQEFQKVLNLIKGGRANNWKGE